MPFSWSDRQVEKTLGKLLRAGVILSALVVLCGGVGYLVQYHAATPETHVFHGEPRQFRNVKAIARDALALDSLGIIQFGLLLLIATPVARVVFSVFAFAIRRDVLYVVITLIVLSVLIFSLTGGHL
jgi:uncharacterized membrane protein